MIYIQMYILLKVVAVQVAKWGNSLAVRLPRSVVQALKLKPGDDIEIIVAGRRRFAVARDHRVKAALTRLRALQRPLPKGFRLDRNEANER